MGDDQGRTFELEQCTVKCMRGILFCYMRQADKVGVALNTVVCQTSCAYSLLITAANLETAAQGSYMYMHVHVKKNSEFGCWIICALMNNS